MGLYPPGPILPMRPDVPALWAHAKAAHMHIAVIDVYWSTHPTLPPLRLSEKFGTDVVTPE